MKVETTIVIHRPIETVFAFVSDVEQRSRELHAEEMEPSTYRFFGIHIVLHNRQLELKEMRQTSPGPLGVGTTYVQVLALPSGGSTETIFQITEYDPPRAIAFKFRGTLVPPCEGKMVLVPLALSTMLTATMKIAGNFYKFAGPFLAPIVKQQAKLNLRKMKAKLESMPEATT